MFEKFGEFDSYEEINRAAAAQKAEGDTEAIKILAKENGLDPEDAQAYIDGEEDELTTLTLAAWGKLDIETREAKIEGVIKDWIEELKAAASEDEALAHGIRRKGKTIKQVIADWASEGFENATIVPKDVVKLCTKRIRDIVGNHDFQIGIPTRKKRLEIARKYYVDNSANPHKDSTREAAGGEA